MTTSGPVLLPPDLLARLERLQIGTRRRLAGRFGGEHRSPARGSSLDFADFRSYVAGDDVRRIDQQAWARLDQLLVRLYEANEDLEVRLLIDTSRSMQGAKLDQARRLAAALGFVALVARDTVSVHVFPVARPAPRFRGRSGVPALFDHLAGIEAAGETAVVDAARQVLARSGPPGLTVLISDLLTPAWDAAITSLPSRGGQLVVAHVLDPADLEPDLLGDLELVDAETGETVSVSVSDVTRRHYRELASRWLDEVAVRCAQVDAAHVVVRSDDDLGVLLVSQWRAAGVLR